MPIVFLPPPLGSAAATAVVQPPRFLDRLRHAIRLPQDSLRTEEGYVAWARRFILFPGKRHPSEIGAAEINAFPTHLAVPGHVSASTRNQAFWTASRREAVRRRTRQSKNTGEERFQGGWSYRGDREFREGGCPVMVCAGRKGSRLG